MRVKTRWILFEATKLALLLGILSIVYTHVTDANYVASAGSLRIDQLESESTERIHELEQVGASSLQEITAARDALDRMEERLELQQASLSNHQASFNEILESQATALESNIRRDLERIEGSTYRQALQVTERVQNLETQIRRSPVEMKRRMIYPIVQLRGNGTVGSGVVISSERESDTGPAITYVLTAFHVVQEITEGLDDPTRIDEIKFMDPDTDRLRAIDAGANVVAFQSDIDIALLKLELPEPWPHVARLASPEDAKKAEIFDAVYAVGCPLGNKPLPTVGEISSQEKLVAGETFWMVNAPTFFGNSGGGVFLCESGRLIGISSMIYTYGKATPMVVPHMGLFVPLGTVRSWLGKEGFAELCTTTEFEIQKASGRDGGPSDR